MKFGRDPRAEVENAADRDEVIDVTNEAQLTLLLAAVRELYYAAVWQADRPVDEAALWTAVRDAAGFNPGRSPVPVPFEGVEVTYDLNRLRLLGKLARKEKVGDFNTDEARAFVLLYRKEIEERIQSTVRAFLKEKL